MSSSNSVNNNNAAEDAKRAYRAEANREVRPTGTPNKDFTKVLNKRSKSDDSDNAKDVEDAASEEEDDENNAAADKSVALGKQRPVSLFDLSGAKPTTAPKMALPATPNKVAKDSDDSDKGSSGSSSMSVKEGNAKFLDPNSDALAAISGRNREGGSGGGSMGSDENASGGGKNQDRAGTRFATDQSDLSYVNPVAAQRTEIASSDVKAEKTQSTTNIQELIKQMVDAVQEMKTKDQTDTTITLKNPPLFAGSTLVVTSFDNARGEFNLSFQGLSQAAKNLLDMNANQASLKLALEQKGYAVHIITTTTEIESVIVAEAPQANAHQSREDQQDQQQGKKKKQQ